MGDLMLLKATQLLCAVALNAILQTPLTGHNTRCTREVALSSLLTTGPLKNSKRSTQDPQLEVALEFPAHHLNHGEPTLPTTKTIGSKSKDGDLMLLRATQLLCAVALNAILQTPLTGPNTRCTREV